MVWSIGVSVGLMVHYRQQDSGNVRLIEEGKALKNGVNLIGRPYRKTLQEDLTGSSYR